MDDPLVDELIAAGDAISKFQGLADGIDSDHALFAQAVEMRMQLAVTSLYLADFVMRRVNGEDATMALEGALKGDMNLTGENQ